MSPHVSAAHAARMYGCSEKTVRRWIAAGRLPAEKIGATYVVDLADVARLVGDVSAPTSAQASAPGTDSVSARSADADVRPDDDDVRPSDRPSALAQADALASLIQATLTPIIAPLVAELAASRQANERQAERHAAELGEQHRQLISQARLIGAQTSELALLRAEVKTLTTAMSTMEARTEAQGVEPTTEPSAPLARLPALWRWLVLVLVVAVTTMAVLLAWPR